MGNRANLVLVDRDGWRLRYSHWVGCRMLDALLAGPEMAERYILAQETARFLVDELWADGGLVLDLVERKLLFFGDELMATMHERRAMFEVLARVWPGYSISWMYDGAAELADYVQSPFHRCDRPSRPELILADDTAKMHHLVTVIDGDGRLRAWPLYWGSSAAWHGPKLVESLPGAGKRVVTLGVLPESGIHVDMRAESLGVWLTTPVPGLLRWLPQLWPGWRIELWGDRFEEHLLRCGPHVTAPELDLNAGITEAEAWLERRVYQTVQDSPAGIVASLATLLGATEPDPEASSSMTQQAPRPTALEWARFRAACAEVRAGIRAA